MASIDKQNRLLIPKDLMDFAEKRCFLYYDYMNQELYISSEIEPESYLLDKLYFDKKNRFFMSKKMRLAFSIDEETQIVFSVKNNNVYLKRGPLNF